MEKLFSPEEVAEYLNVKPEAVRIWLRTTKIRGSKLGNVWRIPESAISEFLAEKENRPPAERKPETAKPEQIYPEPINISEVEDFTPPVEIVELGPETKVVETPSFIENENYGFENPQDTVTEVSNYNEAPYHEPYNETNPELIDDSYIENNLAEESVVEEEKEDKKPPLGEEDKLKAAFDQFDPFS